MSLAVPGNLDPYCYPCFTNGETETQGSLEVQWATWLQSGFESGLVQRQSPCPNCSALQLLSGQGQLGSPPYLYYRVQRRLRSPRLAVILHQASGHKAEATEQLMGTSTGGDAWGVCKRRWRRM